MFGVETFDAIKPPLDEGSDGFFAAGKAGMSEDSEATGFMDEFNGVFSRDFALRNPGRFAALKEALERLVEGAADLALDQSAGDVWTARGIAIGNGPDVLFLEGKFEFLKAGDDLANAILADLLEAGHFGKESRMFNVEEVADEMKFNSVHLGGKFTGGDKFDAGGIAGSFHAGATFDRIVIGEGDGAEGVALGVLDEFFGSVGAV
jgi:hypothetical protein